MILYHAVREEDYLPGIMRRGLIPRESYEPGLWSGRKLFLSDTPSNVTPWGPIILEVSIPSDVKVHSTRGEVGDPEEYWVSKRIPPEYIRVYSVDKDW